MLKHAALRRKNTNWFGRNQDYVSEGETCLFADCCFSETKKQYTQKTKNKQTNKQINKQT
jgi:hypothetical protein